MPELSMTFRSYYNLIAGNEIVFNASNGYQTSYIHSSNPAKENRILIDPSTFRSLTILSNSQQPITLPIAMAIRNRGEFYADDLFNTVDVIGDPCYSVYQHEVDLPIWLCIGGIVVDIMSLE